MSAPGRREVANRLFAAEYDDASFSYSESDEERAPNYVVTPTGARVNRLFLVGVLTEKERVNDDMIRARIVDPTGPFVVYAGQYQPEALTALERLDAPAFVAVTGKARTFSPEDSERVYTSVRPESIAEVDADTRDRWVVVTAERTLERIGAMAGARLSGLSGNALREALIGEDVPPSLAAGIPLALEHYDTSGAYLAAVREAALDAARVVAGEADEVERLALAPNEGGDDALAAFADADIAALEAPTGAESPETVEPVPEAAATAAATETGDEPEPSPEATPEPTAAAAEPETEPEPEPTPAEPEEPPPAPPGGDAPPADETDDEDLGDFDAGEFEMPEETREEIEEEFGTGFETGNEVDPAGEAGIEPEAAPAEDEELESEPEPAADAEPDEDVATEAEEEPAEESASEDGAAADVDLESAVVDLMRELDEGDGAAESEIVDAATDRFGADADAVEKAIQSALMSGQCYEPSDGSFKPI
jgi:RPA family protein